MRLFKSGDDNAAEIANLVFSQFDRVLDKLIKVEAELLALQVTLRRHDRDIRIYFVGLTVFIVVVICGFVLRVKLV